MSTDCSSDRNGQNSRYLRFCFPYFISQIGANQATSPRIRAPDVLELSLGHLISHQHYVYGDRVVGSELSVISVDLSRVNYRCVRVNYYL